jgi:hypothetical protein
MRTLTGASPYDPTNPKVYVSESKDRKMKAVVVDQEPIYIFPERGRVQVRWQIETPNYKFDATTGIGQIRTLAGQGGQLHSCQAEANSKDQVFVCTFDNSSPGRYKYTIHVVATDGSASPRPLDPTFGND